MDWFREVNAYCERTDPSYWSEPVNAISNASFLIAAFLCWKMLEGRRDFASRALTVNLFLIGIGSWLFHTHAQVWAAVADVVPIQAFILIYVYFATVRFFALPWWAGAAAVALFIPYAMVVGQGVAALFGPLNSSVSYVPVPILIAGYGVALLGRAPETGRGLLIGAGILAVSLVFRTLDQAVCDAVPTGTHWVWHLLNGVMLGWMIRVMHRHGAGAAPEAGLARGAAGG